MSLSLQGYQGPLSQACPHAPAVSQPGLLKSAFITQLGQPLTPTAPGTSQRQPIWLPPPPLSPDTGFFQAGSPGSTFLLFLKPSLHVPLKQSPGRCSTNNLAQTTSKPITYHFSPSPSAWARPIYSAPRHTAGIHSLYSEAA